tara:strand:+ start:95009 stop:95845 length:837 start_codon:yes stop_codon:yes gene_type:complete
MSENTSEELNKSIDSLIDELFVEDNVEKSIDIAGDSKTLADSVKAPKGQKDDSRGAGRPKQISDVPENDEDGKRSGEYDSSISEGGKEQDQPEASQVKEANQIKPNGKAAKPNAPKMAPFKKSNGEDVTAEEWEAFEAFKKSQKDAEVEEMKKAQVQEQTDLIKSVVEQTASRFTGKIEELTKSLNEQKEIVKSFAKSPKQAKSITNLEAVEKSFDGSGAPKVESFTKGEIADAAVELAMNKSFPSFTENHAIEVENNGYIYDEQARKTLEAYLQKKN